MARDIGRMLALAVAVVCMGSAPRKVRSVAIIDGFDGDGYSIHPCPPSSGIALWMHPTAARIVVSASADAPLKACEVGTTFSYYWRGGCRRLVGGRLMLPTTSGGAVHVGFRIAPIGGRSVHVERLQVQWHCVDHFFLLQRGVTRARLRAPVIFDC